MTRNPSGKVFLGRNQKIFGPLSADEIDALKRSGQLSSYTWIFKEGDGHWTPIDPPPALPDGAFADEVVPSQPTVPEQTVPEYTAPTMATRPAQPALRVARTPNVPTETYRAVLFDHRNAISGWLNGANDTGCEILSDQNGPDPLFVLNEAAFLSLHDTRSGETIKLRVRISSISRVALDSGEPGKAGWCYRANWEAMPSLLDGVTHSNRRQTREVAA